MAKKILYFFCLVAYAVGVIGASAIPSMAAAGPSPSASRRGAWRYGVPLR